MKYYFKILITLSYTYLESSVSFKIKFLPTLFWNDTEKKKMTLSVLLQSQQKVKTFFALFVNPELNV